MRFRSPLTRLGDLPRADMALASPPFCPPRRVRCLISNGARSAPESPSTALFADGIPDGERLIPTPDGRTPYARIASIASDAESR